MVRGAVGQGGHVTTAEGGGLPDGVVPPGSQVVTDGAPTVGCVAVDRETLRALLRWLRPDAGPVLDVAVG